ncbi:MAG TPA: nickel-dependent lactate racemase [Bacteroidota bacterium]|nr:nickel-dependent lactate racemase [Bacteroidota bacterium]
MNIHLAYGKDGLDIEVPEKNLVGVLTHATATPLSDAAGSIENALRTPIESPALGELARNVRSACIAVCDITRPVPNKQLLPPILRTLNECGLPDDAITILVATGLHRPSTDPEKELMLGGEIVKKYRVVDHKATMLAEQRYLGTTKKNTPVFIDSRYVDAELKITVGFIEPHLMAGFSGGRKLIAPGNAGEETIKALHSPKFLDDPLCCEGSIDRNPLHHELLEIAGMAGHDFMVDVALDVEKRITGVFAGHPVKAHAAGVRSVRTFVRAALRKPADIVVTTSAGFPLDLTYYQAVKGMTAALPILKDGGMLILAAECAEGLGGESFSAMATRFRTAEEFDAWIHSHPVEIDQWQLQESVKAVRRGEVVVVARGIEAAQREKLFVHSAGSVEEAIESGLRKLGRDAAIAVIPKGPYTLVEVEPDAA